MSLSHTPKNVDMNTEKLADCISSIPGQSCRMDLADDQGFTLWGVQWHDITILIIQGENDSSISERSRAFDDGTD